MVILDPVDHLPSPKNPYDKNELKAHVDCLMSAFAWAFADEER